MKKLFWGFFFVYLNFNLNLNEHSISILPNFVGWLLILKGMDALSHESPYFERPRPFVLALVVYEALLWVGNILAVVNDGWIASLLGTLGAVAALYVIWLLVQGVAETEQKHHADLNSPALYRRWKWLLAVQVAVRLLGFMANLSNLPVLVVLSIGLVIVSLVVMVAFIIDWYTAAKCYEGLGQEPAAGPAAEGTEE